MKTRHIIAAALFSITVNASADPVAVTESGPIELVGQLDIPTYTGWYVVLEGSNMAADCAYGAVFGDFTTSVGKAAHKMLMNTKLANDMGQRVTDQLNQALSSFDVPEVIWDEATVSVTYDLGTAVVGGVTVPNACFVTSSGLD